MKRRWRSAEQHRRARPDDLRHRQAGKDVDAVENESANQRRWRDEAHQRYRHDLDWNTCFDTVEQVLTGVVALTELAGWRNRENGHWFGDKICVTSAKQL